MALFNKNNRKGGLMDEIRCDEPSYLIWKWHPSGSQPGANNRENAIRWGSSLRVKDGEVAVFVYKHKDGTMQDFIVGPFDQTIKTSNFPVLASIVGLAYEGGTPFQAEIYFINLARIIQVKFGVPFFDVYDPRFADFGVPVAVRGTVSFSIGDYREFIKLHRLSSFNLDDFQKQIRDAVNRYVKDAVANAPAAHNIPVIQIESKTAQINDVVEYDLSERLKETFGVVVSGIDIGAIEIDKSSDGYRQLMSVTKDLAGATAKAEAEAKGRKSLFSLFRLLWGEIYLPCGIYGHQKNLFRILDAQCGKAIFQPVPVPAHKTEIGLDHMPVADDHHRVASVLRLYLQLRWLHRAF